MIKLLLFQFSANGGYLGSVNLTALHDLNINMGLLLTQSVTCDLIQTALYSRREDVLLFFILDYGIDVNYVLQVTYY